MRLLRAEPEPALAAVFEFLGLGVNGGLAPDALARIARADAVDPESENGFNRERLAGGSGWLGGGSAAARRAPAAAEPAAAEAERGAPRPDLRNLTMLPATRALLTDFFARHWAEAGFGRWHDAACAEESRYDGEGVERPPINRTAWLLAREQAKNDKKRAQAEAKEAKRAAKAEAHAAQVAAHRAAVNIGASAAELQTG